MKRSYVVAILVLCVGVAAVPGLRADVKTEEKTLVKLGGALGRIAGIFGGKAMRDGVVSTVALKGDRKMEVNENTGEIVDLSEQKVYSLDMKKKTYEVVTFEELRRRMQESMQKARESAREAQPEKQAEEKPEKEMEFEISMKETGQRRTIAGYDCREVLLTVTAHEKGKTLDEAGGMMMTSHLWQTPRVPELKELEEFNIRYAKALMGTDMAVAAEQMATAMAMYPAMKDMMAKAQAENVKLDGTTILTETNFEMVASPEQMKQQGDEEKKESSGIGSMGGIGGMLGRRIMRKKSEDTAPKDAAAKNRTSVMTMTNEIIRVSKDVGAGDVSIPAGFREKR